MSQNKKPYHVCVELYCSTKIMAHVPLVSVSAIDIVATALVKMCVAAKKSIRTNRWKSSQRGYIAVISVSMCAPPSAKTINLQVHQHIPLPSHRVTLSYTASCMGGNQPHRGSVPIMPSYR